MIFTSYDYLLFFVLVFALYWGIPRRSFQNLLLLVSSYLFYGWIHPWFCALIATSTLVDYACGLGMGRSPARKRPWLLLSLIVNLGMLAVFKYFNFFAENVQAAAGTVGLQLDPVTLRVFLPVGISFYTFQTLSYTIDVYRGKLEPRRSLLDFAVYVSFFPQLVAGPIERATHFLPQIESERRWRSDHLVQATPLIVFGYLKKLVIADNVALVVDKLFMLDQPSPLMLLVAALAFAVQIYADFSAYTDIARGSARLLGFELMENFDSPYLAITPSDFWRRWHISFSSWIRDYLYIPLGGSRSGSRWATLRILLISLGLSGLWHGAAWNFVAWGIYHALLLFAWRALGLGGRWRPANRVSHLTAWAAMFGFTLIGWLIFRAPSMAWLGRALAGTLSATSTPDHLAALYSLATIAIYSSPFLVLWVLSRGPRLPAPARSILVGLCLVVLVLFAREGSQDFIYFRF